MRDQQSPHCAFTVKFCSAHSGAGRLEMLAFCEAQGLDCLDLTPTLTDQANVGNLVYHARDTHLNELGNAVLAEKLAPELTNRLNR